MTLNFIFFNALLTEKFQMVFFLKKTLILFFRPLQGTRETLFWITDTCSPATRSFNFKTLGGLNFLVVNEYFKNARF